MSAERYEPPNPHGRYRYGSWHGGPDPLAPPYDVRAAVDKIGADLLSAGNLYVANGQIWVYDKDGRETRRIDVPERPLQLLIGGPDRRTLFILAHHTLYAVGI